MDQVVSAQPGLMPAMSGHLANFRVTAAAVFADHFSDFACAHLMKSAAQEETPQAKLAFKKLAETCGITILSCHADDGRFAESAFQQKVEECNQTITFCGVGAHHQNDIAEHSIKDLTSTA